MIHGCLGDVATVALRGTDLAAGGRSTGRRPDALPRMAPRGCVCVLTQAQCA